MTSPRRLLGIAAACVALGLVASGCGGLSILPGFGGGGRCGSGAHQDGPRASTAQLGVVCRWSAALRAGHISAAAGFFHLPGVFEDGPAEVVAIHTAAQARLVNESLTCGAAVISAFRDGRYINVLFRLTARAGPGGGHAACGSGIGLSARTAFLIRDGRIVQWLRAPSRPGDPGVQGSGSGSGSSSQGGGSAL